MTDQAHNGALSPDLLVGMFQGLDVPLVVIDYDTRHIMAVNNAFLAESGYAADQIVGQETKHFSMFSSDEQREQLYAQLATQGQATVDVFVRGPHGDGGNVTFYLSLLDVGGKRYILVRSDPVRRMTGEARSQMKRLQDVLSVVPGVIYQYTYDAAGRGQFTYISKKAEALFGLPTEFFVFNEPAFWRQVPYEYRLEVRESFLTAAARNTSWACEFPFVHAVTKEVLWVYVIAFPKTMADGSVVWTGFCSDITEIHRLRQAQLETCRLLEEERLRKSKLESLGTLAGGIAHDFNNLLAVLTGNLGLLKCDPSLSLENQRRLDAIERASERAKLLAKQLVTFAKGGDPILESVSPETFVVEPMRYILEGRGIQVHFEVASPLWLVRADVGQLMQVFQNLAVNAADAMPQGGSVVVKLQNCALSDQDVPGLGAGDYLQITVTDTGCGIDPEHVSRIFDPYFTTKSGGHGLGLAIVYSVIAKHGGQITVSSKVNVGTRFDVYLPAKKTGEITLQSSRLTDDVAAGILQRRLLVMDDDELIRDLLGAALETFGYGVVVSRHGEEAIERYRAAMESGHPFLGVILDLRIANGLGGRETLEHLRQLNPNVTAIVCSGYHDDSVMANYRTHGFAAKLPKPFDVNELGRLLERLFGSSEAL